MTLSKIVKNGKYLLLMLVNIYILGCKTNETFTISKIGSDQVLNGSVQKEILLDQKKFPWFNYQYNSYKPDSSQIALLKRESKNVFVLVFAGSWCSDTQQELPRFYKIMDLCEISKNQYDVVMLDQTKKCRYINVDAMQIKNVPTFIFYREGKEIGRIVENPSNTLESDIYNLYRPN
jgi:thiol-disulfide isomerase/thioredoxin